jgi:hypothetical protein
MYVYIYILYIYTHTHTHTHINSYTLMLVWSVGSLVQVSKMLGVSLCAWVYSVCMCFCMRTAVPAFVCALQSRQNFLKVSSAVASYGKCTMALTF